MIYDTLDNLPYENVKIFLLNPPDQTGRYELGSGIYANIDEYCTKPDGFPEAHKKYIDVQVVLEGVERLDFACIDGLQVKDEYNPERDIMFYHKPEILNSVYLTPGKFVLLEPHDAHAPQLGNGERVKKVVVKIPV